MDTLAAGPWLGPLEAAAGDGLSGATAIAAQAAAAMAMLAEGAPAADQAELLGQCIAAGRELHAGQPTMAALLNLLDAVVKAVRTAEQVPAARLAAAQAARAFVLSQEEHQGLISRLGGALLRRECTVLTHSYSSVVVGALLRAHESGRAPRVICTESRPRCEGIALARRLHAAGLATTLVLDSAAFDALGEADLVLLGADSLALPGVYNKVGTAGLAWAAAVRGTPCYVLTSTAKLWPAALGVPPHILEHAAAEVWPDAPEGVRVINRYFDVTPWSAVSGVVTEQGLLSAEGAVRMIQEARVDEALRDIV